MKVKAIPRKRAVTAEVEGLGKVQHVLKVTHPGLIRPRLEKTYPGRRVTITKEHWRA